TTLLSLPLLPAYEDKQKLKRTEISGRSWFPPAQAPGGKASDTLKKLGLAGKAAPPKALTGGSQITVGHLGIVRRKSREGPESLRSPGESTEQGARTGGQSRDAAAHGTPQQSSPVATDDVLPAVGTASTCSASLSSSLVADYSNSSSDSEVD
ncbi:coiled-coil domain containing 130, partial [Chelydra serpentina]